MNTRYIAHYLEAATPPVPTPNGHGLTPTATPGVGGTVAIDGAAVCNPPVQG